MWSLHLGINIFFATVIFKLAAFPPPNPFGCKNSLISDDWRKMVLDFHNNNRRIVAHGNQLTLDGKTMPVAKDMNELTWDCNLEHNAWLYTCEPTTTAIPQDAVAITADIKLTNKNCNATTVTKTQLRTWWDEAKAVDLSVDPIYQAKVENFATMANAEATGFGCSYNRCNGVGKLVCLYNKKLANTNPIYTEGGPGEECKPCKPQTLQCVSYLCQPEYKLATDTTPEPKCPNADLTYDLEQTALNMHNYYRRLLATGWAKDTKGYAKWASKMPALTYDCNIADKSKAIADCSKDTYPADQGYTLNFHKEYITGGSLPSREETLKKAVKAWFGQLDNIDLGDDATFNDKVSNNANFFANMVQDAAKNLGCAVTECAAKGYTVAVCQYDSIPINNDPLYTVGKTCSKCGQGQCEELGGLCKP